LSQAFYSLIRPFKPPKTKEYERIDCSDMGISGLFRDIYNLSYVLYYSDKAIKALRRLIK